ncbi:hypothetical protein ACFX11_041065 [Malus domestica]
MKEIGCNISLVANGAQHQEESNAIMGLIEKIVANGAHDFGSAIVRTSFMASCVQAFHDRTTSTIACAVTEMA